MESDSLQSLCVRFMLWFLLILLHFRVMIKYLNALFIKGYCHEHITEDVDKNDGGVCSF